MVAEGDVMTPRDTTWSAAILGILISFLRPFTSLLSAKALKQLHAAVFTFAVPFARFIRFVGEFYVEFAF